MPSFQNSNQQQKIAFIISRIFGPVPVICLLWLTTALKSGIGFWHALWVYPVIFIISLGIPIAIAFYLVNIKKKVDIEWKSLSDRRKYSPIVLYSLLSATVLIYFLTNATTFHLALVLDAIMLCVLAIYRFTSFKVSGHILVSTLTISAINLYFSTKFIWLFLLLLPIMWARKTLKVHTWTELLAGFLIPMSIILISIAIFGWPSIR